MTPEPRLPLIAPADWDDEQQRVLGPLLDDGEVLNIFAALAHHPGLVERWLPFGTHLLFQSSLPARLRELVILRVGWRCGAEYEFGQHTLIARQAGVSDEEIRAVTEPLDVGSWEEVEALALRATDEIVDHHEVSAGTWSALAQHLEAVGLLDLLFTVGQYQMVSAVLNTLQVPLDDAVPGFPDPG